MLEREELDMAVKAVRSFETGIADNIELIELGEADGDLQLVALAHLFARLFGVVPEVRGFGFGVQRVEAQLGGIPVKDASSAGSTPAGFRPRSFRFPSAL